MSQLVTFLLTLLIAALTVVAVYSVFVFINFFGFERPFAEELIRRGFGREALKSATVKKRFLRGAAFFLVSAGGSLALIALVGTMGAVVCLVSAALCLLFLRPNRVMFTRSDYNIASFYASYKAYLNTGKFLSAYPESAKILKQQGKT